MLEDPYKILQVDPEAEDEVVQAAYRRLARKYHPDVAPGPAAEARMAAINRAWAVLRTPESRAAHDRRRAEALARLADRPPPASPPSPGVGSRTSGSSTPGAAHRPETVSRDWTSGRSTVGGGYDPATMRSTEGYGAAGPPPGNPSGTVVNFGRYAGWSLGEIARRDIEYIEWLDRAPIGRQYRDEIDGLLRRAGKRRSAEPSDTDRRGLFRRR